MASLAASFSGDLTSLRTSYVAGDQCASLRTCLHYAAAGPEDGGWFPGGSR